MSTVDELVKQLPYGDGAWRRRFISGLIFFAILLTYNVLTHGTFVFSGSDPYTESQITDLLKNTQLLVVIALLIFAIGSLIDAIASGFIFRGVSMSFRIANEIFDWQKSWTWLNRRLWIVITICCSFPVWPLAIIFGTISSTAGIGRLYKIGLCNESQSLNTPLADEAKSFFDKLPKNIQKGLDRPFGTNFEASWQALLEISPIFHKPWINRLGLRNYEIVSFHSSAMVGMLVAACTYFPNDGWTYFHYFIWYGLLCLFSYSFFGCLVIVRRSILSVLELLSFSLQSKYKNHL